MKITLYVRTYPVKDAPVGVSLVPFPTNQRHTYTLEGKVYEAVRRDMELIVPDGSVVDTDKKLLSWVGDQGPMKSTATEVYDFVKAGVSGFRPA